MNQRRERLNQDTIDAEDRRKPAPGYHPFSKNTKSNVKGMINRFDVSEGGEAMTGDALKDQIDTHEKVTY